MDKFKKALNRFFFSVGIVFLVVISSLLIYINRVDWNMSDEEFANFYADASIQPTSNYYPYAGDSIHYVQVGYDTLPTVVFIHGTPGTWDNFKEYLKNDKLLENYQLISIDRVGFGNSRSNVCESSLQEHSKALKPILELTNTKSIVLGHSYGGSVAMQLAIDYPSLVDGLILAAAPFDPELEAPRWYNKIGDFKLIQLLLPNPFVHSNAEMMQLKDELVLMEESLTDIEIPITVIQGESDNLNDYRTNDYLEKELLNADLEFVTDKKMGHLIPWDYPHLIIKSINSFPLE